LTNSSAAAYFGSRWKALMRELGFHDYWLYGSFPAQCHAVGDDDFACD
jgi:hypothetical protein